MDGLPLQAANSSRTQSRHVWSRAPAGQLPIAKRPGSPFAKEIIALRIQGAAGIEGVDIVDPLPDGRATFQEQRLVTLFGQQ